MSIPEIKNLKKAAKRIKKAIERKEKIILYGDADLDGVSSVVILKEAIMNLGGEVRAVYFPDRETEGYGINNGALNYLKKHGKALFISLDLGIGNFEEIRLAKKMGFEVMILDHHRVLKKLPAAPIIVDPHQKGDAYPFKDMCAAGVVFKVAEELLKEKLAPALRSNFLELVALATIADMMPQTDDNLIFLGEGLISLKNSFRPGLRVFWQIDPADRENIKQVPQKIISACNASQAKGHLNEIYLLLTSTSDEQAKILALKLLEKASLRQSRIKEVTEEIEIRLLKKIEDPIVFEGGKSWEVLMLGPAASRICQSQKKPIFLYAERAEESQGAVRTPQGVDGVKAMIHCANLLETYGGHPQAAGFRVKNENLEKFKTCLVEYFKA